MGLSLMIFWKEMIKGLYEKQLLSEKSYSCLQEFLDTEECKKILSVSFKNIEEKNLYQQKILHILDNYECDREDEAVLCYNKISLEKKVACVNELYEKGRLYILLYYICFPQFDKIREEMESNVCYRKYQKKMSLEGGKFSLNPLHDLCIGGVKRGELYKREPKDIREKVEFCFDEEGKLLIEKWHKDEQELRSISFYFYSRSYVFSFWFTMDRDDEKCLEYIYLQEWEEEKISGWERAKMEYSLSGRFRERAIWGIRAEKMIYKDKILKFWLSKDFIFPKKSMSSEVGQGLLGCDLYRFEHDENKRLTIYRTCKDVLAVDEGREPEDVPDDIYKYEIISSGTEPEASRWKRPNYFNK